MMDFQEMLDAMLDQFPKAAGKIEALKAEIGMGHDEGPAEPESAGEDKAEGGEPAMPGMFKPMPEDMMDEEPAADDEEEMY